MIANSSGIGIDKNLEQKITLELLWHAALEGEMPVAIWRMPASEKKQVIIDLSGKVKKRRIEIEEEQSGFAISPFLNPELKDTRFLNADIYFETTDQKLSINNQFNDIAFTSFIANLERVSSSNSTINRRKKLSFTINNSRDNSESSFKKLVAKGIQEIQSGKLQKVVLSRSRRVQISDNFDLLAMFERLCIAYPKAFVSLYYLPEDGIWMGASPEILVSVDENQVFRTISLAGTQARKEDVADGQAVWTQKEIEEQALVSRYIINCFKKIRLRDFEESGPKTVAAGNLLHLRTDFKVDMKATGFLNLGSLMLDLLHPTSAVCGMPLKEAMNFILENESHNRELYSGFIGPVNIKEQTHLYVNLRCMQIFNDNVLIYAGAGVTSDSDTEKEWQETEIKTQTLLKILNV